MISNRLQTATRHLRHGLALAIFALPALCAHAAPIELDKIIAVVNDDILMQSQYQEQLSFIQQQIAQSGQRAPDAAMLRSQILDKLILDQILKQKAQAIGIQVTDQELNGTLNKIAARNGLTLPAFRAALEAEGTSFEIARERIRQELLTANTQRAYVNRKITISDQEVDLFLETEGLEGERPEYNLAHILIAVPTQASPKMINDAEVKAQKVYRQIKEGADFAQQALTYSNAANALDGGSLGWRPQDELPTFLAKAVKGLNKGDVSQPIRSPSGFHIIKVNDIRGIEISLVEKTKARHLLLRSSEIRTPTETRAQIYELYRRIQRGESLAELAKEFSDDTGSGAQGGDLGWTQPGVMVAEFEEVMNNTAIGATSAPFETRFGWHILQVEGRRTEDMTDEMRRNRARNVIGNRRFNEELENWLREIRTEAYIEIKE